MADSTLGEFIRINRDALILRCHERAAKNGGAPPAGGASDRGIPIFLNQLIDELAEEGSQTRGIRKVALEHGHDLYFQGFTVSQVVHDYGHVCQSVTGMAVERSAPVTTAEFRTLNRCLDDAIADAVTEYARQQRLANAGQAHEMQTLVDTALAAFEVLQKGSVGVGGSTGGLVYRSLVEMRTRIAGAIITSAPPPQR